MGAVLRARRGVKPVYVSDRSREGNIFRDGLHDEIPASGDGPMCASALPRNPESKKPGLADRAWNLVAGTGFEPVTFGL